MDALTNQPWNLSNQDAGQLTEDDFMAYVQKQFPGLGGSALISGFQLFNNPVNPQNVASRSISTLTPPVSENDSPSPSNSNPDQMPEGGIEDPTLKRKASGDRLGSEPSNKSQHTESSPDKHSVLGMTQATRRKSLGHTPKDEQRLMKRKEQNRAAQRAFRERKEKHVKDLEDKVAELEARNEATQHENENLRDMLDRLQSENISLKQSGFTFSVPKNGEAPSSNHSPSADSIYSPVNSINTALVSPKVSNPLDWSSLTSFDPNILNILDENITQPTAKGHPIPNFGFGTYTGLPPNLSFRTIAENRMFMTPASVFDNLNDTANRTAVTPGVYPNNGTDDFQQFDLNSLPAWPGPSSNLSSNHTEPLFDDLYSGYLSAITAQEFAPLSGTTPMLSPITHQTSPASLVARSTSIVSPLPPSVLGTDSLFTPPADSPPIDSDHSTTSTATVAGTPEFSGQPPKSRSDCRRKIAESGDSVFAPPLQHANDDVNPMIKCVGSNIPITEKNDRNVEILSAFTTAMADPQFRNFDMNGFCEEFKKKACCDGTSVVEPGAVSEIMENLSKSGVL